MALHEVPALVDAGEACDADAGDSDAAGVAQIVDVGRHPAAEGQLLQEVGRFVVAADENGEHRRRLLARVVLVEGAHFAVFLRHGHAIQVVLVAHGLEVAAAQQQVHLDVFLLLEVRQSFVNSLQLAVSAPFHCHLHLRTLSSCRPLIVQFQLDLFITGVFALAERKQTRRKPAMHEF